MNQRELIAKFNKQFRPQFNRKLFKRQDSDIINALKDVIYSVERDSAFTIKVVEFEVITNYDDVNHILWEYEDNIINKGKKKSDDNRKKSYGKKKKVNQYEYINLNRSELNLIKITYFMQIVEKKDGLVNDYLTVYTAVPKIIDDFYFMLNGNLYSAMYQIVDASTYNNSASKNSKKQSITYKTVFSPIRVYRYTVTLKDNDGLLIPCTYFVINVFRKSVLLMKYMLAQFGFYGTVEFLNLAGVFVVDNIDGVNKDENYIFPIRDWYIIANKALYDNSQIMQSYIYTIWNIMNYSKHLPNMTDFFIKDTYICALGGEFTTSKAHKDIHAKGLSLLDSLEFNYDRASKRDLKLADYDKDDIYRVLRWIIYEFNALRQKDNLDITTKKVRYAEYIASLYATKLATGIYRISDAGENATLKTIRQALNIAPMYLINAIINCELVNYKNCVNDLDAIIALKYTYKGIAGIGEKSNAVSDAYRSIQPSHLGRVDIDSSSNSDPGVSGTICPYAKLYDDHFDEYEEPSTWLDNTNKLIDTYKTAASKVEMCRIVEDLDLNKKPQNNTITVEASRAAMDLSARSLKANQDPEYINGIDLFGDGMLFYLSDEDSIVFG